MTIEQARKEYKMTVIEKGFFSSDAQDSFNIWLELSNSIKADLTPEEREVIVARNGWYSPKF